MAVLSSDVPRPDAAAGNAAVTLVLGGARSGKSMWAENHVRACGLAPVYLATAEAHDEEMRRRIAIHRARRDEHWTTAEEPLDLAGALRDHAGKGRAVLVDCLTLWLANLMAAGFDVALESEALCRELGTIEGHVTLVSNEVGQGIVPDNQLARDFRDHAGLLHQQVAAVAGRVVLVTAGLAQVLK
jgi:adenosylcobinamide kinase / adenosylcobinamide-phosphate guanylyltransferase